jgi:hypothetical protein
MAEDDLPRRCAKTEQAYAAAYQAPRQALAEMRAVLAADNPKAALAVAERFATAADEILAVERGFGRDQ